MTRRLGLVVAVAILVFGAGCRSSRLESGQARLALGGGARVVTVQPGEAPREASDGMVLRGGDEVRVLGGTATVTMEQGAVLELRRGSEIRVGDRPTLVSGDLLVVPASGRPLTIQAAGSRLTVAGAARVERDLAVSAASYREGLQVESAGRRLDVAALREATIASLGDVPGKAGPLDYDVDDPWDRRYLGAAIDLGTDLDARSRGFSASLKPGEGRTPGFYRLLLPALETEAGFDSSLLSEARPPGEMLVGTAIALAGQGEVFAARHAEVFAFRDEGAAWGLVALDHGVAEVPGVVESIDVAIGRAPLAFPPPPVIAQQGVGASLGAAADRRQPIVPDGAAAPPARPKPEEPTVGQAPPATIPLPATPPPVAPVLAPVVDLLAGLLPGVISPSSPLPLP